MKPTRTEQLNRAYGTLIKHVKALPDDGQIIYKRGHGFYITSAQRDPIYLGTYAQGISWMQRTLHTGQPNYAELRKR